jgi:hypothetical protein
MTAAELNTTVASADPRFLSYIDSPNGHSASMRIYQTAKYHCSIIASAHPKSTAAKINRFQSVLLW